MTLTDGRSVAAGRPSDLVGSAGGDLDRDGELHVGVELHVDPVGTHVTDRLVEVDLAAIDAEAGLIETVGVVVSYSVAVADAGVPVV